MQNISILSSNSFIRNIFLFSFIFPFLLLFFGFFPSTTYHSHFSHTQTFLSSLFYHLHFYQHILSFHSQYIHSHHTHNLSYFLILFFFVFSSSWLSEVPILSTPSTSTLAVRVCSQHKAEWAFLSQRIGIKQKKYAFEIISLFSHHLSFFFFFFF